MESFSLVLLEAWSEGTPTLCDAACGPMAEHTREAGGGLVYRDAGSFSAGLQTLAAPGARERFGDRGPRRTCSSGSAGTRSAQRFRSAVEELACAIVIDATPLALPPTGIGTYLRDTTRRLRPDAARARDRRAVDGRPHRDGRPRASTSTRRRASCAASARARLVRAAPPRQHRAGAAAGADCGPRRSASSARSGCYPRQRSGVRGAIVYDLVPLRVPAVDDARDGGAARPQAGRREALRRGGLHQRGDGRRRAQPPRHRRRARAVARPGVGDRFRDAAPRAAGRTRPGAPTSPASARTSRARTS